MKSLIKKVIIVSCVLGSSFASAYDLNCKAGAFVAPKKINGTFKGSTIESYEGMVGDIKFEANYEVATRDVSLTITDYVNNIRVNGGGGLDNRTNSFKLNYQITKGANVIFECTRI